MFKNIGSTKLLILIVLLVIAGGAGIYTEMYLKPELEKSERNLRTTKSQVNEMRDNIARVEEELETFIARQEDYQVLILAGFFDDQKRDVVEQTLDEAQRMSGIIGGGFQINTPSCYTNDDLADSDYVIIGSPISLNIESYDDTRVYRFLDLFKKKLPGFAVLENMEVIKVQDITNGVLRDIGQGEKVPLIRSKIEMKWYTIVSKEGSGCTTL
jgi:hypothetical protein